MGILTLGIGLAIGFGLAKGPITHADTAAPYWGPCTSSRTHTGTNVSCSAPVVSVTANSWRQGTSLTIWSPSSAEFPKGFAVCMTKTLNTLFPRGLSGSTAGVQSQEKRVFKACGLRGKL